VSGRRIPRAYADALTRAPAGVRAGQFVADVHELPQGGELVVFVIGMRVNRWRRVRSWWPTFVAMPRMLAELQADDADAGLLAARTFWSGRVFLVIQYWRSAEELGAYARNGAMRHAPAWGAFNRDAAGTGDVGIFHETYVVPRDDIESLYGNMPPFGLGSALGLAARGDAPHPTRANHKLDTTEPDYLEAG
jgi:hypothetical protein